MRPLLLASTSPFRKKLLEDAGFRFKTQKPLVDEEELKNKSKAPLKELPLFLAKAKAESLVKDFPDHIIIGSDQVALLGDTLLNKPKTKDEAMDRLQELSGKTHELLTAIAVYCDGHWKTHTERASMTMTSLAPEEIVNYVERDLPIGCAGGYKIESLGITLFESIQTKDHHSIVGLPLLALTRFLRELGFRL